MTTCHLIIVMGVSGSGKSTLGKALAQHYGVTFLDADDFHSDENKQKMASGIPLTDVERDPWVWTIGEQLIAIRKKKQHCVIAFSGLKARHRDFFRCLGFQTHFFCLHVQVALLQQRLQQRKSHFFLPILLQSQIDAMEDVSLEQDITTLDANESQDSLVRECDTLLRHKLNLCLP